MDFEKVVAVYKETDSLRETAVKCNISTGKVRKILVTCGVYDSPLFQYISDLRENGKSIKEISEILNRSSQCIISYLPYIRGERTGESQTANAIRIRKYRDKNKS